MIKKIAQILIFILVANISFAQEANESQRLQKIEQKLQSAAQTLPGLKNPVDISINNYTIQELIRAVAKANNLNVSVDPTLNATPSYNFTNASVADVFLFLCKEHQLTIEWTGNIMAFKRHVSEPEKPEPVRPKSIQLSYSKSDSTINADLKNDTLYNVVRKIAQLSGVNINLPSALHDQLVTMTIVDQKLDVVVDRLAQEYLWKKLSPDYYVISTIKEVIEKQDNTTANNSRKSYPSNRRSGYSNNAQNQENMELIDITYKDSLLTFSAENQPIKDIVAQMSDLVGVDYFLFSEPQNNITLNINKQSYDDVLSFLLNTTDYTFKKDNGVYIIGERKQERLRTTKMVKLQYRTTDKVIDVIPTEIRKNVEVKEFPELNSIILSGAELQIQEIEKFLKAIDKTVPVVLIEVMIVDVKTSYSITTGLKVGNDPNQSSSGTFNNNDQSPDGVNVTLDENSLNSIVQSILSLGWVNLGNVGNGFYFQMKALEENGKLKMNSTPKLATLNGHEASMSIGETRYFAQDQTNIIGTQNPQTVVTRTFTPVNADLSLNIKPMVSGDNQVTLEITVSQSTFTKQEGQAPPEFETREFQSLIRLKNQEMVVLGGLDRNRKSDSGTGVPVLSRIPVIKWFFSNKTKEKDHSVLTIFIRPTIIY